MEALKAITGWDAHDRRRLLQIVLGCIWLVDAALQFQPYMFTKSFDVTVLQPAAQGVPGVLGRSITSMSHFLLPHVAVWNALFATVQLALAIGLFLRPTVRFALGASVVWSVLVWWFGEGFGGIFTSTSPVMGLPGGVILYAILAILLWPPRSSPRTDCSIAEASPLRPLPARILWFVLWVAFAVYFLLPVNSGPDSLHDMVAGMGSGEPAWTKSLDNAMAWGVGSDGRVISILLAALCAYIAFAVLIRRETPAALATAIGLSILFWLFEDFGGVFTGSGTDVNTGPLLVVLALAYWEPRSPGALAILEEDLSWSRFSRLRRSA